MVTSTVPPGARSTSPCGPSAGLPALSLVGGPPPGPHSSAPGGAPAPGAGNPPNRCCDTGRTIYTDPVSGQTICSCQYDMLNYQRLAAAGGVPLGVYPEGMSAYLSGIAADQPLQGVSGSWLWHHLALPLLLAAIWGNFSPAICLTLSRLS